MVIIERGARKRGRAWGEKNIKFSIDVIVEDRETQPKYDLLGGKLRNVSV